MNVDILIGRLEDVLFFCFLFIVALSVLQSFDICGRVSAIRKALVMLCSSQVRLRLI